MDKDLVIILKDALIERYKTLLEIDNEIIKSLKKENDYLRLIIERRCKNETQKKKD